MLQYKDVKLKTVTILFYYSTYGYKRTTAIFIADNKVVYQQDTRRD